MTPDELKWKRGGPGTNAHPTNELFLYVRMKDREGNPFFVAYRDPPSKPEYRRLFGIPYFVVDRGHVRRHETNIWQGDNMLALMCTVEALGLTPEVTDEDLGEGTHRGP